MAKHEESPGSPWSPVGRPVYLGEAGALQRGLRASAIEARIESPTEKARWPEAAHTVLVRESDLERALILREGLVEPDLPADADEAAEEREAASVGRVAKALCGAFFGFLTGARVARAARSGPLVGLGIAVGLALMAFAGVLWATSPNRGGDSERGR